MFNEICPAVRTPSKCSLLLILMEILFKRASERVASFIYPAALFPNWGVALGVPAQRNLTSPCAPLNRTFCINNSRKTEPYFVQTLHSLIHSKSFKRYFRWSCEIAHVDATFSLLYCEGYIYKGRKLGEVGENGNNNSAFSTFVA